MRREIFWFGFWMAAMGAGGAEAGEIRVHYPVQAKSGDRVTLRGDTAPLRWDRGLEARSAREGVWIFEVPDWLGRVEFKPLLNDVEWTLGPNSVLQTGNASVDVHPRFRETRGRVVDGGVVESAELGNRRALRVYLPPGYGENTLVRYPVLYMHDGQNLFDDENSASGREWRVDEAMDEGIGAGELREAIVVGIDNTSQRTDEYTPIEDKEHGGGRADAYLDFIESTVMPRVNARFRTLTGPGQTVMAGSSLGGLLSCYAGWTRARVYGTVGCFSGSHGWGENYLIHHVRSSNGVPRALRIYLDVGGVNDGAPHTTAMRDALQERGFVAGANLFHVYDPEGIHHETSWARRLPAALRFLLGR